MAMQVAKPRTARGSHGRATRLQPGSISRFRHTSVSSSVFAAASSTCWPTRHTCQWAIPASSTVTLPGPSSRPRDTTRSCSRIRRAASTRSCMRLHISAFDRRTITPCWGLVCCASSPPPRKRSTSRCSTASKSLTFLTCAYLGCTSSCLWSCIQERGSLPARIHRSSGNSSLAGWNSLRTCSSAAKLNSELVAERASRWTWSASRLSQRPSHL
mmetsp:Transcript_27388/g.48900  ORF Transcript_27388/g.48900 Transcript_27388/m.48900 type:complete len:214 (-) Transcript_27388:792-1433(-)